MSYRLILFDLDGTLLDPVRVIRPSSRAILAELMAAGVRVGFATGRMPRSVAQFTAMVKVTGPLIVFNGAMVWDLDLGRPVYSRTLALADAIAAARIALAEGVHVNCYMPDEILIDHESETSRHSAIKDGIQQHVVGDLPGYLQARGEGPVKLLLIDEVGDITRLAAPIREALGSGCMLVQSEPAYLEVLPPGVSKGDALVHIEEVYGIAPAEIIAFGDERNDLELVERCGLGVAMANAHEALKAVADVVIGHHDSDAIYEFLAAQFEVSGGVLRRR